MSQAVILDQEVISWLKKLNQEGKTDGQIAEAIGVSICTVARWRSVINVPRPKMKDKIRLLLSGPLMPQPDPLANDRSQMKRLLTVGDIEFLQVMQKQLGSLTLELAFQLLLQRRLES